MVKGKFVRWVFVLSMMFVCITIGYACSNGSSPTSAQTSSPTPTPAPAPVVTAMYYDGSSQSLPDSAQTIVNFDAKNFDTMNAVTTGANWKFIAPISGYYSVQTAVEISNCNWTAATMRSLRLVENGGAGPTFDLDYVWDTASHSTPVTLHGEIILQLNAGDYFSVEIYQDTGGTCTLSTIRNISIAKVGS